jgi:serine/threonine protein kinase
MLVDVRLVGAQGKAEQGKSGEDCVHSFHGTPSPRDLFTHNGEAGGIPCMTLAAGSRLGPYEVLSPIGAGGMGEVFRARDARLGREVAIKVLPASFSSDPERLRRFEQEARAAGALNHPNITSVHDIGSHEGAPFIVQELLEGETLRAAMAGGRLAPRRAIDFAVQIARGLAAAHEKGIVHRDLKPENVFVTKDGRVKILDFGLAKLTHAGAERDVTGLPTETHGTDPGTVMGTLGYMSPEQLRGHAADARSDLFAFGAILYEMLAGQRAFKGDSAADTISAILREEPADLSVTNKGIAPGLERIVRHCLEKSPEQRFQSARDVAFDLDALSTMTGDAPAPLPRDRRRARVSAIAAGLLGVILAAAISFEAGRRMQQRVPAKSRAFRQLTFHPEPILTARFAPDGKTVVYSSVPEGRTPVVTAIRTDYAGSAPAGHPGIHLLSVSSKGELAVLTKATWPRHSFFDGTLARMPLDGGAPREVVEGVREADWSPDGSDLAVIRTVAGKDRLEFPLGKVLCETPGYLSGLRFAPSGDRIGFFEHPVRWDDRGGVAVIDLAGRKTVLAGGFWGEEGLAWSPRGDEVLFSAGTAYDDFKVWAVTMAGARRIALESAGGITIHDVRSDGRWLATRDDIVAELRVVAPGSAGERELSWLDFSLDPILSGDGKTLLFTEESGIVGGNYAVCLRGTDGSPVVRLGEGHAFDLSPDGKWALAAVDSAPPRLVLYPTGPGTVRTLDRGSISGYQAATFFPDGRRVLVSGHEEGHANRCWVQPLDGGAPKALTPEGLSDGVVSPDGRLVVARREGEGLFLVPAEGSAPRALAGSRPDDVVVRWSADGRHVLVGAVEESPASVSRLDIATGKRGPLVTLAPPDRHGVLRTTGVSISHDEKSFAYSILRTTSHLFVVEPPR